MAATPEQPAAHGAGPELERRYCLEVARPRLSPTALMHAIQADLPSFAPQSLADFERRSGQPGALHVGDEFYVKILGPWNGGVRVTAVDAVSFELATLEGHPEAGRISFKVWVPNAEPDQLQFQIHSRARSRDGVVAFVYDTLGGGKLMQEATWVEFCQRVAQASGGEALGPVLVETIRRAPGQPNKVTRHHV